MLTHRWLFAPPAPAPFTARFPEYPALVAQILYNRGIHTPEDAHHFMNGADAPGGSALGSDPFLMLGMREAVARLRRAIGEGDAIAVYGDFDADGVCATALLTQALKQLGAKALPYIPHRMDEGYGLNPEALKDLKSKGARVVVTVDCGIRSLKEVDEGTELGLDMIVTDHHSVGEELPRCVAVVNPKQKGDPYPFKEFAGVGIAFKLAQALAQEQERNPLPNFGYVDTDGLLDLVALGTVADLVPLVGENRVLVKRGVEKLVKTERPGLQAMLQQAAGRNRAVDTGTIGFVLGPRLNAAGRIDHARIAYKLLVTEYPGEAEDLATRLEATNRERQRMTDEMVTKARGVMAGLPQDSLIFLVRGEDFPEGIIGLIASKLQEERYRPVVAIAPQKDGDLRGSARSIPELNIVAALDECAALLVRHGGHSAAAGFTVKSENYEALLAQLRTIAERELATADLAPSLTIDAEANLSEMNWKLLEALTRLAPFGHGNREPIFCARNVIIKQARIVGNDHLSLTVTDGIVVWDAIAFRQGAVMAQLNPLPKQVDLVFNLTSRVWGGDSRLQLQVKDMRVVD